MNNNSLIILNDALVYPFGLYNNYFIIEACLF